MRKNHRKYSDDSIFTEIYDSDVDDEVEYFQIKRAEEKGFLEMRTLNLVFSNESCLCVVLRDQTKLKCYNEERLKAKYQNLLITTVSHELRTPLNGIMGALELLLPEIKSGEGKKMISVADRSSHLLLHLINGILDLSLLEGSNFFLKNNPFNLRTSVNECMDLVEMDIDNTQINFQCEVNNALPLLIFGDEQRFKQILLTLLGNSAKSTIYGEINVKIDFSASTQMITCMVKDTGIGIRDEDKEALFQLYGKIKSTTSDFVHGSGLGISIHLLLSI